MKQSLSRLLSFYGALDALPLLRMMIREEFPGKIALLTSFGADAALLLSMVAEINPATPVLFLNTGKHFPETLDYARDLEKHLGLKAIRRILPDAKMIGHIDGHGELWNIQPNQCCWLRKVEPLNRALAQMGFDAIITGRKRYQTSERSGMERIEQDPQGRFRINPLAYWDKAHIASEREKRNLPPHPLAAQGFRSIGCAPCTVAVGVDVNERDGRWAHTRAVLNEQKVECGIHLPQDRDMNWSV